jgi:hypothetical protein
MCGEHYGLAGFNANPAKCFVSYAVRGVIGISVAQRDLQIANLASGLIS